MGRMSQSMSVLTSNASVDYYTPPPWIMRARAVLGGIDLDPASAPYPQTWIRARRYLDMNSDGLHTPWYGRVFCNPPYSFTNGKSNQKVWSEKATREYESGRVTACLLLVNSTQGYEWYENLWYKFPVCCLRERIAFITPGGKVGGAAKRGQTFVYMGANLTKFTEVFAPYGKIILP